MLNREQKDEEEVFFFLSLKERKIPIRLLADCNEAHSSNIAGPKVEKRFAYFHFRAAKKIINQVKSSNLK